MWKVEELFRRFAPTPAVNALDFLDECLFDALYAIKRKAYEHALQRKLPTGPYAR